MMNILETKNLTKIYMQGTENIRAVNNCSITVKNGEFIAVIGSSGSGKSTLLHLCGGLETPTGGNVYIDKIDIYKLSKRDLAILRRRKIGMIFQQYNLLPSMTAKENIILPSLIDKNDYDKTYFHELAEVMGISNSLNHLPNELSGGQQQRVALARALINKPSIILADEPTGNLDKKTAEKLLELLMESMKKYNQTIILATHDLKIAALADRSLKIDDGVVIG